MRRRLAGLLGVALGLVLGLAGDAAAAPTAAPPPDELMRRIDAAQADLRTLAGEFVQNSRSKLFKQQLSSQGRLYYERQGQSGAPTKLRWEYTRPDASTMLLIGARATLRIGTRPPQVFDSSRDPTLNAIFSQLQLWLGNGSLASAQADYQVSSGGTADRPVLVLAPRPTSPLSRAFSRIELHVDGRTLQLGRLLLVENSGDEKEVVFTRLQRNAVLPQTAFQ
ncbi:MAG TPA: outer membrane lipoprotein carrier protein LolA [Pseudomonadota bacterium]|nr:outer membrane lipoprotein carrier protein LolA [Pseudomonadota bacterium]